MGTRFALQESMSKYLGLIPRILAAVLVTLIATEVSAKTHPIPDRELEGSPPPPTAETPRQDHTCIIRTGYGTAIGHGNSKLAAKENARIICGEKLMDRHFAQRRDVSSDVTDDVVLACVNLECQ